MSVILYYFLKRMVDFLFLFFFSSRRRHTRYWRDWSSDVCSSDLIGFNRVPVAAPITPELEANLLKGSPKISPARARALANAAIREACEETGLCLGRKVEKPAKLDGAWKPFADAGLLPDPSGLFLIARAITPPGRVRRFDTRFFTADASAIAHRVEGVIHADAELVELVWVEIGSKPLADAHAMTKNVLA